MVNMQTIDVDKIIDIARKYADEHDLCEVVDKALVEAGILTKQSGYITLRIPIVDYVDSVAYGRDSTSGVYVSVFDKNCDVDIWEGVVEGDNFTFVPDDSVGDKIKATEAEVKAKEDADKWRYTSTRGQVVHFFPYYMSNRVGGMSALCGAEAYSHMSIRADDQRVRKCARCESRK